MLFTTRPLSLAVTPRVRSAAFLMIALRAATTLGPLCSPITPSLLILKLVLLVPAEFPMIRTHFIRFPVIVRGVSSKSSARSVRPYVIPPGCVNVAVIEGHRGVFGVSSVPRDMLAKNVPSACQSTTPEMTHPVAVARVTLMIPFLQMISSLFMVIL